MREFINWFALLLAIALTIYGIVGLQSGQVSVTSYAFNEKPSNVGGKKALVLSIAWIIVGLLGTVAFGGHLLGIAAVAPIYDVFMGLIKSD
jgi:hypothetical protein